MPKGPVMQESRNSEKTAEAPVLRVLWNGSRQNQGSAEKGKYLNGPEIESLERKARMMPAAGERAELGEAARPRGEKEEGV